MTSGPRCLSPLRLRSRARVPVRSGRDSRGGDCGGSVDKCPERGGDLNRAQWSKPQGPTAVEFLAEAVRCPASFEVHLVTFGAFVSRYPLEGGVKPVPAVVDWPDRETIWDGSCCRWKVCV
jgi:hypothetical protein